MRGSGPKATAAATVATATAAASATATAEAVQHRGVPAQAEGPRSRQGGRHQDILRVSSLTLTDKAYIICYYG